MGRRTPDLPVVVAAFARQAFDFGVVEIVLVLVLQERNVVAFLVLEIVLGELRKLVLGRGVGRLVVVVGDERRLVRDLVEFRGRAVLVLLVLVFVDLSRT